MIVFCQDNLRAGCGNKFSVKVSEKVGDVTRYKIPDDSIKDGQVAFNFKKDGLWLAIPDCRVKTAGKVGMGMSYPSNDIPESGGAHFVYTGGGMSVWSPVSANGCNEAKASVARETAEKEPAEKSTNNGADQGAVAVATNQSAAAAHNSAAATNQSAAANNSSQANATSFLNINQVNDGKGKGKKKGGNVAIIYAPNAKQDVQNNNIRGNSADIKVYLNKSGKGGKDGSTGIKNIITYVGPSFPIIHIGVKGAETYDVNACTKCHHASAADDERARKMILTQMSSALAGEKKPAKVAPVKGPEKKKNFFLDGTPKKDNGS